MIIWIMGVSGSGKTTTANILNKVLHKENKTTYIIDGDEFRKKFFGDLGYSLKDRRENIKRTIIYACAIEPYYDVVIIANIHPFEDLRHMAKASFNAYKQVYLKISQSIAVKRSKIGYLYNEAGELVGRDLEFEISSLNDVEISTISNDFNMVKKILEDWLINEKI
ncbi:adenylyl-sulfate kinase [Paracoccaceae bacterium]|nr:adenylyl-sulfate kinase [Paracoccaceae bacterium]